MYWEYKYISKQQGQTHLVASIKRKKNTERGIWEQGAKEHVTYLLHGAESFLRS